MKSSRHFSLRLPDRWSPRTRREGVPPRDLAPRGLGQDFGEYCPNRGLPLPWEKVLEYYGTCAADRSANYHGYQIWPRSNSDRRPIVNGLQPIEINREPLASEVVRRLIDAILTQRMSPGDRLPSERKLAEMLGAGRSVVREALKPLSILGLVEVRQGDGTYLTSPDSGLLVRAIEWGLLLGTHEALDLVEARCHLEEVVAELAASRRNDRHVEELYALLTQMKASQDDIEQFVTAH